MIVIFENTGLSVNFTFQMLSNKLFSYYSRPLEKKMRNTSNFEEWATGKNPLLAIVAHSQITVAKMAYGFTKAIHEEDMFFSELPAPDLGTWLKLFRSHPNGINYVHQFISNSDSFIEFTNNLEDQFKQSTPITLADISIPNAKKLYDQYIKTLKTSFQTLQIQKMEELILAPEFYFFFRIFIPCQLFHNTTPAQLLRKARLHDFDSLKKIIRLDHATIFDKRISRYIYKLRSTNKSKYEQIIAILSCKSKSKITRQKFKVFYAAIITQISIQFGERLTEPEVRALFDAVSRDEGHGDIDIDLPDSPNTLYHAIKRRIDSAQ